MLVTILNHNEKPILVEANHVSYVVETQMVDVSRIVLVGGTGIDTKEKLADLMKIINEGKSK